MKYIRKKLLFCMLLIASLSKALVVDTIENRVMEDLISNANLFQVDVTPFINSIQLNGSWNDINYKSSAVAEYLEPPYPIAILLRPNWLLNRVYQLQTIDSGQDNHKLYNHKNITNCLIIKKRNHELTKP